MPLTHARIGRTYVIGKISGPQHLRRQLAGFGIVPSGTVSLVNDNFGNMIIQVRDSRLSLNKTIAHHIHIN